MRSTHHDCRCHAVNRPLPLRERGAEQAAGVWRKAGEGCPSHLHRPAFDRHRRLADGFRERRMWMAGAGDVFRGCAEFDRQREWARQVGKTGKLPSNMGRLDLDRPERQLLWAATIIHAFGNEKIKKEDFTIDPLVKAVTHSRFVDSMYNQLAYQFPPECKMILGEPGSWFYFRPDEREPQINLDLCYSLIAGGGLYQAQGT